MKLNTVIYRGVVMSVLMLAANSLTGDEARTISTNVPASITATTPPTIKRVNRQNEEIAQGRLQPTTPEQMITKHGPVGAIFTRPQRVNPLQLLNPFAAAEYGGVGSAESTWSWNPMQSPGQGPMPRAFQNDRTHEASGVIINLSGR